MNRQPHPKYPAAQFLVGVGSAFLSGDETRDRSTAEASARKDLLTQIQVSVKALDLHLLDLEERP